MAPLAVSEEKLAEFFEHKLAPEQRDWLLSLGSDDMNWALRQMYFSHLRSPDEPVRLPTRPAWTRRPAFGYPAQIRPRRSEQSPPREIGPPKPGSRGQPNRGQRKGEPADKGRHTETGKRPGPAN